MPGFGSGLAHALTQGYVGAQEGMKDRDLIVLAAQQRAQQRQQQEREMKLKELGALSTAAQAGLDVTPTAPSAPSGPPSSVPPVAVADTASVRAVKGQNPTTPDGGESSPATPSQDGTVLGTVGGMSVKVPQGGVLGKAARDDAAKNAQRTADLLKRAQPLNAKLPAGHPFKLSDDQLAGVAADPSLYNEWAKGALGINADKNPIMGSDAWKKAKQWEFANTPRATAEPSWQVLQTDEGTFERNPKTGQTRPVLDPQGNPMMPRAARGVLKQVAENTAQLQAIDTAIAQVKSHPNALGLSRMLPDAMNQRIDPAGVGTRAALSNVGSLLVHDRSGATVTVSESKRLNPFVPRETDDPKAALEKLTQLRSLLQTETDALAGGSAHPAASAGQAAAPQAQPHVQTIDEMIRAGKSDAEIKAALQLGTH
jgi:hypothetical protein